MTPRELAVLRATLERGADIRLAPNVFAALGSLRVIGGCGCGCESLDFVEHDPQRPSRPIAHGTGTTPAGGDVGLIVWGTDEAVVGLEVYDLGAGQQDIKLPLEDSVRPFVAGESTAR